MQQIHSAVRTLLFPVQWLLGKLFLGLIYFYRYVISPVTPSSCRFYPTCSEYGLIAIKKHGAFYGGWLTIKRILRCNPLFEGGFDPVPERQVRTAKSCVEDDCGCHSSSHLSDDN